jgi:hypothetical protein
MRRSTERNCATKLLARLGSDAEVDTDTMPFGSSEVEAGLSRWPHHRRGGSERHHDGARRCPRRSAGRFPHARLDPPQDPGLDRLTPNAIGESRGLLHRHRSTSVAMSTSRTPSGDLSNRSGQCVLRRSIARPSVRRGRGACSPNKSTTSSTTFRTTLSICHYLLTPTDSMCTRGTISHTRTTPNLPPL